MIEHDANELRSRTTVSELMTWLAGQPADAPVLIEYEGGCCLAESFDLELRGREVTFVAH